MLDYHRQTREDWNSRAEHWGRDGQPAPEFLDIYEQHQGEFGKKVLDIGCGKGRYIKFLAQRGGEVTGIDLSEEMLNGAKEELKKSGLRAVLVQGQSTELPFPNQSFDSAVSVGAIHHNLWNDIQQSFSEAARVLKPDSIFVFQGRSKRDTMKPRIQVPDYGYTAIDSEGDKKGVQHYFTLEEIQQLADENGFTIVDKPKEVKEPKKDDAERIHARWWVVLRKNN